MAHRYSVYGVSLASDMPFDFPLETHPPAGAPSVRFERGGEDCFRDVGAVQPDAERWFSCSDLADGSLYFRWSGLYEFRADADGARVRYRAVGGTSADVLQNFLFGQVLSFALVRQGVEPVHAAVVDVGGEAIALLGDCTHGKSTLAGAFLGAGCRLVTDDVLVMRRQDGVLFAQPGTGRIKLMADAARAQLPGRSGVPVFPGAGKHVFRLGDAHLQASPVPLRAFVVLPSPDDRARCARAELVSIGRAQLFHHLVKNTYVRFVEDGPRLGRNFAANAHAAEAVAGFALRYPVGLHRLPAVVALVVEHVRGCLQGDAA
jgi:hypothetical protein